MTSEKLQEILNNVWMRDWSADDGHDAIWAEPFDGATQITPRHETARPDAGFVSVQRVDMPAARWEENARALIKIALELAYELRSRCDDPIHDEQIASLRALETEWAGSGHIDKSSDLRP